MRQFRLIALFLFCGASLSLISCTSGQDEYELRDKTIWEEGNRSVSLVSPEGGALDEPQNILFYSTDKKNKFFRFLNIRFCINTDISINDNTVKLYYDNISYVHEYTDNNRGVGFDVTSCRKGTDCDKDAADEESRIQLRCYGS